MARPTGSVAEVHKTRRDYRFGQETMQQIADGLAVFGGSLKETAFVERAVAHYAEFLAGDPVSLAPLTQEMEWLQEHIRRLRHDQQGSQGVAQYAAEKATDQALEIEHLRDQIHELEEEQRQARATIEGAQAQIRRMERELRAAQAAQHQAEEQRTKSTSSTHTKHPAKSKEPHITLDDLKPRGTMGGYWLKWEQYGLLAIVSLDALDQHTSARGYKLDCSYSHATHVEKPLTDRQDSQGRLLVKLARARMIEELLKAGWQPDDPTHPETAVWHYRRVTH